MSKLANQYGKALFEAAYADNSEREFKNELDKISSASDKKDGGDVLIQLINKNLLGSFEDVYKGFSEKYNECHGTIDLEIVSAFPLKELERSHIISKMEQISEKRVNVIEQVDTSLIGGVVLKFDGNEIDGSVKAQLSNIRKNIV